MRSSGCQLRRQSDVGLTSLAGSVLLLVMVFPILSCEQAITLKGTITLPVTVQQKLSENARGRLVMRAEYAASGSPIGGETIYMLCEPGSMDLTVPFTLTKFGCAKELYAEAMVIPLSGDPQADTFRGLPCGPMSGPSGGAFSGISIAYGRQLVFEGRKGGSCDSATAVADITVTLTE